MGLHVCGIGLHWKTRALSWIGILPSNTMGKTPPAFDHTNERKPISTWHSPKLTVRSIILHALAIIGLAHLSSYFRSPHQTLRKSSLNSDNADIYPDTDYPLRPATEPWDISTSYPYPRNLSTTVTEGTWLRITTHPALPEIVFDMLGDLYCMAIPDLSTAAEPITAKPETAHSILTGIPFDKEAEFSPDGSQLVFISDAGFGVDNIWTMPYSTCAEMAKQTAEKARSSTVQQTNSTFRFFSSLAFHPSEPKIIATKWFLTGRPNGAGEIWEFPFQNGSNKNSLPERGGKRLIQRKLPPSWSADQYQESQLGSEQARYTPSGDGVIHSRNVKDDLTGKFSYNKDVHAGINAVFLLNTTTMLTTELAGAATSSPNKPASPGGANMPRLSHDGRTLAFVRRVDDKSVLVLKDMTSGTVHHVWDGLDYDLSTIPAFMGAYPNYGLVAGDKGIVIWAQGQIWLVKLRFNHLGERVPDADQHHGAAVKLPFKANIELALGETRYQERNITNSELAKQRFIHAFRGLRSDNNGQKVVFEAAGDNILADVQTGEVQEVPKPDPAASCYAPSFVHETGYILQACWDAQNLTTFVLAGLQDGHSHFITEVTGLPQGRYLSPVSDGRWIVWVRTGKDYMFGDVVETFHEGIWVAKIELPSDSSDSTASLSSLRRLYGVVSSAETKLSLASGVLFVENPTSVAKYSLNSRRIDIVARGKTSVEMAGSPQASGVVAFRDFQHIWLAPSPQKAAMWSKPGHDQTPRELIRLSSVGGHDVTFSGNGKIVFWLLGPVLHHVPVEAALSQCLGASLQSRDSGECARQIVQTQGLSISFETALSQQMAVLQDKPLVIVNASLISMDSGAPKITPNATIITRGGQILAAGTGSDVEIPESLSETLNVGGGAVLPGFVDVHGHWGGFLSPYPARSWEMETFLGYGVTTIHNPASRNVNGHVERNLIEKGRMYGPRVFHTGDVLYGSTQPSVYTEIHSRADARDALLRVYTEGGEGTSLSVKNYQLSARSARQRLLLEAAELGMLVVPEGGWSLDWGLTYFIDGYTSHEHPLPIPILYEDILSLVAASGSSYTPLAMMNYGGIFGQHWIHQTQYIPGDTKLRKYVRHDILESLTEVKQAPNSSYLFFNTTKSTAKLAARGVRTNVGAHGEQPIGYLYHGEMKMMGLGGQTPYEVLRAATLGGATSLGLQSSIGSVEAGKLADLVIYPPGCGTVLEVWEQSMHMKYVMRGGTLFEVEDGLVEVWPRKGRRQARGRLNADD